MFNLVRNDLIPPMCKADIDIVRSLESYILQAPQTEIETRHVLHAGIYARTIMIPSGVILTGVLVKIPTILVMNGECIVYVGDVAKEYKGYNVLAASAIRKQAFIAQTDTHLTMFFSTDAKTIEDAEKEFTDDVDILMSRKVNAVNEIMVTGE